MRNVLPKLLAVVGTIALVPALIDPLEGGIILVIAALLLVIAGRLAEVPMPKVVWIPLVIALVMGVATIAIAIFADPARGSSVWIAMIAGNWLYRLATIATLVGSVIFTFKMFSRPEPGDAPVAPPAS